MSLTPEQRKELRKELRKALILAFPSQPQLELMVEDELGEPFKAILRTELNGYNTVGEEIRIVWMGFNEGWVQV